MQSLIEMSLGVAIGAITFTGSLIAFAKLNGNMSGAPILLPARHLLNIVISVPLIVLSSSFRASSAGLGLLGHRRPGVRVRHHADHPDRRRRHAGGGLDAQLLFGLGGGGLGFTLENTTLIITGALVGSSGAILTYIMCKGMNRSFISVILGGFGGETAAAAGASRDAAGQAGLGRGRRLHHEKRLQRDHRARLWHGGGPGPACAARNGRQAEGRRASR